MSTCRVCHKYNEPLFKYSTRHYAHAGCGFQKWGAAFLDMVPAHMLGQLPFRDIDDAGLLPEVERRIEAQDATAS